MTATAAWRWCLAAGVIAFICSVGFGHIPGLIACGPTGGMGPIIAFEFARTPAEVAALFGAEPCRTTLIAAQRTGLLLDAFGFIPSYTAFLCFAAWATESSWRRLLIAGVLLAGLCDQIEGALLYAILRDLPGTAGQLDALWWPVHIKFGLLAAGSVGIGVALCPPRWRERKVVVLLGILIAASGAGAFVRLIADASKMMPFFTLAWTTLLLVAAIGAVWPRLLAARPPAPARPSA